MAYDANFLSNIEKTKIQQGDKVRSSEVFKVVF